MVDYSSIDWAKILEEAEKKKISGKLPPTWKPSSPGDKLYGVVVDVRPNPWDKTAVSLVIRIPSGKELMTPRNQTLLSLIEQCQPKVGDIVVITYEGEGVRKPGRNPPKIFSMYVKKSEELESQAVSGKTGAEEVEEKIVTAEEVEREFEKELDAAVDYVEEALGIYGALHEKKLDKLLQQKGFRVSSKDILRLGIFETDRYGYIRRKEEKNK